jgi:radical SAM superfamily enzyme YgiQ (UPF0313 family)
MTIQAEIIDTKARRAVPLGAEEAERQKRQIARAIKPFSGKVTLPPMLSESKRVLLIVPPGTKEEHSGRLSGAFGQLPMLGLAFISASLRDQGHEIKVIDYEVNNWPMSRVREDVKAYRPDVVGLTAYITNMIRCARVAETCKEVDPKIVTIFGGPQVTIFPDEAFASPHLDMVVFSEGEIVIRNVMNALGDEKKLNEVKGIWYRRADGGIQKNSREILVDDLDIFPKPSLDLFELYKYSPPIYVRGKKVAHLLTSRGCPFQCTFCETKLTFGRSFRYHSVERIVEDLKALCAMGYDGFQFYDDIFTANRQRVLALCKGIIDSELKIKWMCWSRTNTLDREMLTAMKRAGCYLINCGMESSDQELMRIIKKNLTRDHHLEAIKICKETGIQLMASFMIGLPGETIKQTKDTIQFAVECGIDYASFSITEPLPGTELWIDAPRYGKFDNTGTYRNSLLTENSAVWIPHGHTREGLKRFVEIGMWRFYMRPRSWWNILKNFYYLPMHRAVRIFHAGIVFFVLGRLRRNNRAHLASKH